MAETVKNTRATQETLETWVSSLDQEDSPGGGNGNPLQYSCLKKSHGLWPGGLQSKESQSDMTE